MTKLTIKGLITIALCVIGMAGAAYAADQAEGRTLRVVASKTEKADIFVPLGHNGDVSAVAFSSDGRIIVSGGKDHTIKLWDAASGRELRSMSGQHSDWVSSVAFSPDGRTIASASLNHDKTIKLWDAASGQELRTLSGSTAVAFSPDGRTIVSSGNNLKLWDAASGRELRTMSLRSGDIALAVAFSPDGRTVVSGNYNKTLSLWDVASGGELVTLNGHGGRVYAVAFSPDGRTIVSGGDDKTIKLWDAASGRELRTLGGHTNNVHAVAFSPDGRTIVSGSWDATIKLWDAASGRELQTLSGRNVGNVHSVAYSPDGRTIVSSGSNLQLWDAASGSELRTLMLRNTSLVSTVAFSPDGRTIVSNNNLWDAASGRNLRTLEKRDYAALAFSPDGRTVVSIDYDKTLNLKETIKLRDAASGRELRTLSGHTDHVNPVAFSPDGRTFVTGSADKTLKLWDATSGSELRTLTGHEGGVSVVAFSPDGHTIVSGSNDKTIKLWDAASGRELRTLSGHTNIVTVVAFFPDGRTIVSGSGDNSLKLWDAASGRELRTLSGHANIVKAVAFSPDGRTVVSGSFDNTLKLWDAASGRELRTFTGHEGMVRVVAFSPDGKVVISGSADGTIRQWTVNSGKEIVKFASFKDGEWVAITPEGYYNASENGDKYLNVRVGNNVYGIDQYRESFYRPDLVKIALAGGSLSDFRNIASVKQPPQVRIVDTPESADNSETKVTLKLTDMGGGIGDVRLYLNGSAVVLDNTRNLQVVAKDEGRSVTKTYTVKLVNGKNSIRVIAFNGDNSMQSSDALHEISASLKVTAKPTLHAIVVGINEFKNQKFTLKYPVADAELFAESLTKSAAGLFEKVDIKKLTTKEETTSENIRKELISLRSLNPDDLFVFYVASHGTVDDGEYFLITSNVGSASTEHLKTDALRQTELKELIANIPTTKKVIVLDTCNSGAMGDALQVAMLTRGMSEETAMKIFSRAVGSTILSASTSTQEALEGYKEHGLFTYVLAEGLSGKADKGKSGFIKTTDLADYVDNEVPAIAEKVFSHAQYPNISISGQPFYIGKVVKP